MRLIDADRLLSDKMKSMYYHLPNGDTAIPIIDIEHAPTVSEWISVKDGLPEIGEDVLVVYEGRITRTWALNKMCGENIWEDERGHWCYVKDTDYWMPIPELPEVD